MFFGLSKKQLLGWGILATGIKVAFGIWVFNQFGWNLPWKQTKYIYFNELFKFKNANKFE